MAHQIDVIYVSQPGKIWVGHVAWEPQLTIDQALFRVGFYALFPDVTVEQLGIGVFAHKATLETVLQPNDRIELCRPLVFDPMESRRRRAAHKETTSPRNKKGR